MPTTVRREPPAPSRARKDDIIQIRASVETRAILNRAAALRGQKLSEFMLERARRQAEEALLDQRCSSWSRRPATPSWPCWTRQPSLFRNWRS
jgi:uncharacterized protein (DUF1778 family)